MRRIVAISLVLAIGFASSAWAASANNAKSVMINHKEAKVRNGPATSYMVLWRPRLYTPLETLATFNDEKGQKWYVVRDVEGDVGWIHYSTVEEKPSAIVTGKVSNVRKDGNAKSQIIFKAPKNYTFKVLKKSKGWYYVQDPDGDKGWINSKEVWDGTSPRPKSGPVRQ